MKDLFSLEGRTALVTGGSRGIGFMIAQGLLAHGAHVYIASRKADACKEAAARLSQFGACEGIAANVSTAEGARALAAEVAQREDALDILVNNAGSAWGEPFANFPESGWDKDVDLNMKAPFFLTQALYGALRAAAAKRPAKVINVVSIDGLSVSARETYAYGASKAGMIHLTRRLALRLAPDNIRVTAIAPAGFPSDLNRAARDTPAEVARKIPAGRVGTAEDMAGAAVYLASRAGDYVVGETIVVDGGATHTKA